MLDINLLKTINYALQPHLLAAGTTGLTVLASGLAVLAGRLTVLTRHDVITTRLHFFIPRR